LTGFFAEVLFSNVAAMKVLIKGGCSIESHLCNGVYEIQISFDTD